MSNETQDDTNAKVPDAEPVFVRPATEEDIKKANTPKPAIFEPVMIGDKLVNISNLEENEKEKLVGGLKKRLGTFVKRNLGSYIDTGDRYKMDQQPNNDTQEDNAQVTADDNVYAGDTRIPDEADEEQTVNQETHEDTEENKAEPQKIGNEYSIPVNKQQSYVLSQKPAEEKTIEDVVLENCDNLEKSFEKLTEKHPQLQAFLGLVKTHITDLKNRCAGLK